MSAADECAGPLSGARAAGADDGYRNTADFLRARLLIGAAEARRRLCLAEGLLPRSSSTASSGPARAPSPPGVFRLPAGSAPQVMVTIDYRDLLTRLGASPDGGPATRQDTPARAAGQTGALLFTGPVTAGTVRKIACDADIIPVLLGSLGRVLDIGRASRIFPPHIRKALTARYRGCAFPGCTVPATCCEAHHITYWSRGGPTGTDNGTLLCSHHHHLIHKEQWTIRMQSGIPWFIPPPHIDPRQQPRRNHYFRPAELMTPV